MRLCTIGVPRFVHDGLEVSERWADLEVGRLAPPALQALVDHAGRFVQVHPDDEQQLAEHGLEAYTESVTGRRRVRKLEPTERKAGNGRART